MQQHIYELGLLGGRCSDIRIRAFGRVYHLHRLVLIQSGFFRAMLCGGYAEDLATASAAATLSHKNSRRDAQPPSSTTTASPLAPNEVDKDVVELQFDDPNISRAAFEYSIARLYGDGPKLVLPFWSTPSSSHPFSPALTMRLSQSSDLQLANLLIDKCSHPATPRFLLSLLATSIYLNIPSVTAQALTLVLCSITPFTVIPYLRFAIGCGIEGTDLHRSASDVMLHDLDEWDWELEGPATTLEELARPDSTPSASKFQRPTDAQSQGEAASDDFHTSFSRKLYVASSSSNSRVASNTLFDSSSAQNRQSHAIYQSVPADDSQSPIPVPDERRSAKKTAGFTEIDSNGPALSVTGNIAPEYHYGITADKIGEACVCWFARWGFDIFELECSMERERIVEIETWIRMCREDHDVARLALLRDRLHTGDVDLLHTSMLPRGRMPDPEERMPSPRLRVWSYPSMPSSWVRAIISSDGFFVPSELHRYEFAKKVVEFRRKQKALINVLDRLIDDWLREDDDKHTPKNTTSFDSSRKMEGGSCNSPSSDAGDGFGFKAFRRASSADAEEEVDATSTPLQEAWDDGVDSTTFSASVDEDEAEYEELFSSGIYYSHMPFQALNKISADVSPTTGRPYTPLNVLQAALWVSNELKTHILSSSRMSRQSTTQTVFQEAEARGEAASNEGNEPLAQEMDGIGELGVSSSIAQFRDAFEASINAANSHRRFSRSRSSTPMYTADDAETSALGGLAASPLMFGAVGGEQTGLLNKRYYLVPSDDTVRFGDGLTSVLGTTVPTASNATRASSSASAATSDDHLGPSGTAAIQMPHTVPIPTVMHHDAAHTSNPRRDRSHHYGIANDVATGRELGEYAYQHLSLTAEASAQMPLGPTQSFHAGSDARRSIAGESGAHSHDPNDEADGADADSIDSAGGSPERWSGYEPMRVGVEFFGIDKLQEKQRLYSPTFFYAGSVWNLYIQVVKKVKGIQLGIYLHRQSLMEQLPPPSAPTPAEGETVPGVSAEAPRPASTGGSRVVSQRDHSGLSTPSGRTDNNDGPGTSRSGRAGGQQPTRNSVFAGPEFDDAAGGGEGSGSFFDTSFASPVRAGGAAYSASLNAGSTITLPSGRSVTRMGGNTGGGGASPEHTSLHDTFASANNHTEGSSSPHGADGGPAANSTTSLASLADFGPSTIGDTSLTNTYLSSSSTAAGRSTQKASSSSQASQPPRPPIVPLYPGGPSVYQSCPLPAIPYRDPRKELRAYFSIHCPSPLGTALTKFSSGPDKFTISQSWGWKSSSLLGTVQLENGDLDSGKAGLWYKFRCVCTIGLV